MSGAVLCSIDGVIAPAADSLIPVTDEGLIRGDGVFEVARLYGRRPFALDEHIARLERSGERIRLAVDAGAVRRDLDALLLASGEAATGGQVRIMLTRGGRRIVMIEPLHRTPDVLRLKTITYAPTRVLDQIKSLSYAANMLCSRLAAEQGYDEALMVTPHGRVLEAPTSSIFWVSGGELFTPPLDEHILASITRAVVIEVTGAQERSVTLAELLDADEAFLASTTREVGPIGQVDDTTFPAPGPVTAEVAARVGEHIAGVLAA